MDDYYPHLRFARGSRWARLQQELDPLIAQGLEQPEIADELRAYVTGVLLDRELDRKTHAFLAVARRFEDTAELSEYLADLVAIPDARTPAEQMTLALWLAPGDTITELRPVRWQSAFFLLFCATVREIFDNMLDEYGLDEGLERLRWARAQLSVDPLVAWRLVESVRAARA